MRRAVFSICATTAMTATLVLVSGSAAEADTSCPSGYACFWTGYDYTGVRRTIGADSGGKGWQPFDYYRFSMKNRFGNRAVFYHLANGEVRCRDAGQEQPQFNYADWFLVTGPDGHC
jgi:Peptidase inhibitor family I36